MQGANHIPGWYTGEIPRWCPLPNWPTDGVPAVDAPTPEQQTYTVDDPELRELLNHVSFLQFAADTGEFLGHDDAMGFLMALEKVEARLKPTDGVPLLNHQSKS